MEIEDFVDEEGGSQADLFCCEFTSIDVVINKVKVFTGAINKSTENGDRCLVAYAPDSNNPNDVEPASAFFTESKKLKELFLNPNRKFPFRGVIKVVRYGENAGFKMFSSSSPITRDDEDNLRFYQRCKFKKNR